MRPTASRGQGAAAPLEDLGGLRARAARAAEAARDRLLAEQHPEGYWKGELETNVTMDAEDLLLREFLGIRTEQDTAASAAWIRACQRGDGTWSTFYEGPPDLSTTVEAYVALRLAGDPPDAPHLLKAAAYVREAGGLRATRVFTRVWLALFGLWPWDDLPALPPEIVLLPPWVPLNIYDFASWARQTIVALAVVFAHRPARPLPFSLPELEADGVPAAEGASSWVDRAFLALDRLLHGYERLARGPVVRRSLRAASLAVAERWILRRQEADGCWGGIQPPWVYSIIALHLQGYPLDHPVLARALEGLEGFVVRDGELRRLEACQSPVWDTALACTALVDAGLPADAPALVRAAEWLLGREVRAIGDWAVRRPGLEPSGWAFEFHNDNYPDIDDTAEVVLALRRCGHPDRERVEAAIRRGRRWVEGMACGDGGWAAFDADNTSPLPGKLPFCDFGEVTDPPSADVTAHVVEMLAVDADADPERLRRGVEWLWRAQEEDGSWFGRWGANHLYGTGAALPALVAAGVDPGDPRIRRAVRFLVEHQNADGGFGEDLRSYRDPAWRARGTSTASQTAWALLALVAAGEAEGAPARRAVAYLVEAQRPDGSWDEPWFTGTGFPGDFYINYHLYRLVFPLSALGRWLGATGGPDEK